MRSAPSPHLYSLILRRLLLLRTPRKNPGGSSGGSIPPCRTASIELVKVTQCDSADTRRRSAFKGQPAETLLVIDGTTGQNAISQARLFDEAAKLTGLVVTKLDSTARGGVIVAIVDTLELPIKFIGLGESADALRPFEASAFVGALFEGVPV